MARILIVHNEPHTLKILSSYLEQDNHLVSHAAGVGEACQGLASNQFEAILTDQKLPDGNSLDVLAAALHADADISVIFFTTPATIEMAEEGICRGAFSFMGMPSGSDVFRAAIRRACDHTTLLRENKLLRATVERLKSAVPSGNGHANTNMGWMETLPASFDLRNLLSTVEKTLIERTLESTHGAQAEAARRLGLSRSDLSYKLLKYELRKVTTSS